MSGLLDEMFKKGTLFFRSYGPFENLGVLNLSAIYLKNRLC